MPILEQSLDQLRAQFEACRSNMETYRTLMVKELDRLLSNARVSQVFPIESRIKTWPSVAEKIGRRNLNLQAITDLTDLVGIRIITLFRRDLLRICELVDDWFNVVQYEDTAGRLATSQFGYQSQHYIIDLPHIWQNVPAFSTLKGFRAELQVRTCTQHIWAAASHTLQYKQEENVPLKSQRSMSRVSAVLESVDVELARLLDEREEQPLHDGAHAQTVLDADSLADLLDELLPKTNKVKSEPYGELLTMLQNLRIGTPSFFRLVIKKHLEAALQYDSYLVNEHDSTDPKLDQIRVRQGVYFSHVGLAQIALAKEFGHNVAKWAGNWNDSNWP